MQVAAGSNKKTADMLFQKDPLALVDKSKIDVVDIGRLAKTIKRDVSAVVVGLFGADKVWKDVKSNKPRYEEMTEISADLKALAKPPRHSNQLLLCQLNRENASTTDKRPTSYNILRDSGAN